MPSGNCKYQYPQCLVFVFGFQCVLSRKFLATAHHSTQSSMVMGRVLSCAEHFRMVASSFEYRQFRCRLGRCLQYHTFSYFRYSAIFAEGRQALCADVPALLCSFGSCYFCSTMISSTCERHSQALLQRQEVGALGGLFWSNSCDVQIAGSKLIVHTASEEAGCGRYSRGLTVVRQLHIRRGVDSHCAGHFQQADLRRILAIQSSINSLCFSPSSTSRSRYQLVRVDSNYRKFVTHAYAENSSSSIQTGRISTVEISKVLDSDEYFFIERCSYRETQ